MAKLAEDVRSKGDVMPIDVINMTPKLTPFIADDDSEYVTNIARLDFVKAKDGTYKVVEINADTPCAMPEAFYGNAVAQKYFAGGEAPVHDAELIEPFVELLKTTLKGRINLTGVNITLAANDEYAEDWANMQYLKNALADYVAAHFTNTPRTGRTCSTLKTLWRIMWRRILTSMNLLMCVRRG